MEKIYYPNRKEWKDILSRPTIDVTTLYNVVREVAEKIEKEGDSAVREYEERFDKVKLGSLAASKEEMDEAGSLISSELKESIVAAYNNIKKFHEAQKFQGKKIETMPGAAPRKNVPDYFFLKRTERIVTEYIFQYFFWRCAGVIRF